MVWERRFYPQLSEFYRGRSASNGERAKSSRRLQSESRCSITAGSLRSSFSGSTTVLRRCGSAYFTGNNSLACPSSSTQTSSQRSSKKPQSTLESGRSSRALLNGCEDHILWLRYPSVCLRRLTFSLADALVREGSFETLRDLFS